MRALFDVTHPALVHLFAPAAEALEAGGHDVTVAAREKDVTTDLLDAAGVPYAVVSHAGAGPLSDRRTSRTRDRSRSTCPPNRSGRGRESGRSSGGPRGPPRRCARGGVRRQRARATRRRPHAPVRGRGLYTFGIRPRRAESAPIRRVPRTRVPPPEPVHAGSGGAATTRRRPRVVVRRGSIRRVGRPPRPRPSRVLTSGETATRRTSRRARDGVRHGRGRTPTAVGGSSLPVEAIHDLLAFADCYVGDSQTMATEAAVLRNARGADERVRWRRRHEQLPGVGDGVRAVTVVRRRGRRNRPRRRVPQGTAT